MEECLFCRIGRGEIPAQTVFSDEYAIIFKDIHPQAPHHYLAIPRTHFASLQDAREEEVEELGKLMKSIRNFVNAEGLTRKGYRLVINSGQDAGQAVAHLHVHILAGRPLAWPPG